MKKRYETPQCEVSEIELRSNMLDGSPTGAPSVTDKNDDETPQLIKERSSGIWEEM